MPDEQDSITVLRLASDDLSDDVVEQAATVFRALVADGAALGWVDPPSTTEIDSLLRQVAAAAEHDDGSLVAAFDGGELVGVGYWRRYVRPTHRPHVDIEKVAIARSAQGRSLGRRLMVELVAAARDAHAEVITLDLRGDNAKAISLYESLGFVRYGTLPRFVAVGAARYDTHFYALDVRAEA